MPILILSLLSLATLATILILILCWQASACREIHDKLVDDLPVGLPESDTDKI